MKDKIPKSEKEQRRVYPPFQPCNREAGGGAGRPGAGTTCMGGTMFFWAMYQGKLERFAKDCACKEAWRSKRSPEAA